MHRLRDAAGAGHLPAAEVARADRLAFLLGRRTYFEVPACFTDCCFVAADALEKLARDGAEAPAWVARLATAGLTHALSDSVYVGTFPSAGIAAGSASPHAEPPQLARSRKAIVDAFNAGADFRDVPGLDSRPVQLHVLHDLGGGTESWLADYSRADMSRTNLVLKSFTDEKSMGTGLALYTHVLDELPLRTWRLATDIGATVPAHLEYRGILGEIISDYCVDGLLVSSLIGHSLDALDTGLPTVVVTHDYYPYCPAINIYFGGVCRKCDGARISECHEKNLRFDPFRTFLPVERVAVRERFMELIRRPGTAMATPSRSVADNLAILNPLFQQVRTATIPHGYGRDLAKIPGADPAPGERLRIVILGQLSVLKGVDLLRAALPELKRFADIYLLGPREMGELFKNEAGVDVITQYAIDELPRHMANINPHVAFLMSIAPETFNYALTELMTLGVPAAATRVGSFAERIEDRETGYLYEPDAVSLVAVARQIDGDRATLARIRANLRGWKARTASEMVADYHRLMPMAPLPPARYPLRNPGSDPGGEAPSRDLALVAQTVTLSGMWKELKALHLQLTIANDARQRELRAYEQRARHLERRAGNAEKQVRERSVALDETARHVQALAAKAHALATQVGMKTAQIDEIHASTSWKVSSPVRWLGTPLRYARILAGCLAPAARNPALISRHFEQLTKAWRSGGLLELKKTLLGLQEAANPEDAWQRYRRVFRNEVRPKIVERIRDMKPRPRVSVLVPTYNTPEPLLRQMLDSVLAQLYPEWELCVADDGSSAPHVARVLEQYAARDARVKLHLGTENKGVSHASNRALALATSDYAVLLDHDDLLEEQALFRVAECILEDRPDMMYSDEVLVSAEKGEVMRYAYRPAFSPELLRSHPYIVHLAGFRTQLLRDIGGFDETLRISQDYDLILRASEKARRIVHIPEILYQWRQLGGSSAGTRQQSEVMEISTALLQQHLERCGEKGRVEPGALFNLFDVRYPLRAGLRVAVIVPTKNHGELLRQCIDSLRATIKEVDYDIVVVDHESDDPETLAYLSSISSQVRVIPYEGVFNFSAINNFAVSQLHGEYSHYLLCNNDIEAIEPGWLGRMLELGQQSSIGIVGAQLMYPDRESIQHAGVCVGAFGAAEHYGKRLRVAVDYVEPGFFELLMVSHEVAAVTAACLLIRKDAFDEVSGFDEAIAVGFGDVDLCLRVAQKGYRVLFSPYAKLIHHESYTRGTSTGDPHPADSALFRYKWRDLLQAGDPYHNPGLSLNNTNWTIKHPLNCSFDIRRRIATRGARGESLPFSVIR
jgi:GT2 family glycosyltransferase/glycosyltransferase involved in cell wall biosynthesis